MIFKEIPPPLGMGLEGAKMYVTDRQLSVLVNREEGRWHLSVAHPRRFPKWGEMREAVEKLIPPDVWLCIPYPPKTHWVNIHPNCFHFWEIQDPLLIEIWRRDGENARIRGDNIPTG